MSSATITTINVVAQPTELRFPLPPNTTLVTSASSSVEVTLRATTKTTSPNHQKKVDVGVNDEIPPKLLRFNDDDDAEEEDEGAQMAAVSAASRAVSGGREWRCSGSLVLFKVKASSPATFKVAPRFGAFFAPPAASSDHGDSIKATSCGKIRISLRTASLKKKSSDDGSRKERFGVQLWQVPAEVAAQAIIRRRKAQQHILPPPPAAAAAAAAAAEDVEEVLSALTEGGGESKSSSKRSSSSSALDVEDLLVTLLSDQQQLCDSALNGDGEYSCPNPPSKPDRGATAIRQLPSLAIVAYLGGSLSQEETTADTARLESQQQQEVTATVAAPSSSACTAELEASVAAAKAAVQRKRKEVSELRQRRKAAAVAVGAASQRLAGQLEEMSSPATVDHEEEGGVNSNTSSSRIAIVNVPFPLAMLLLLMTFLFSFVFARTAGWNRVHHGSSVSDSNTYGGDDVDGLLSPSPSPSSVGEAIGELLPEWVSSTRRPTR